MSKKETNLNHLIKSDKAVRNAKMAGEGNDRAYPFTRLSSDQKERMNKGIEIGYNNWPLSSEEAKDEWIIKGYNIGKRQREAEEYETKRGRR